MIDPTQDGVDHINIYLQGKTLVGRMLSNLYAADVTIPGVGKFRCLEGYWYWLSVHDDRLKKTAGFASKALGRLLRNNRLPPDPDFKTKIRDAIWYKLVQNPNIMKEVANSTLPFKHYYNYRGKVVEVPEFDWLVYIHEEFRHHLKTRYEIR